MKVRKKHFPIRFILILISSVFLIWFLLPVFTVVGLKIGNVTGIIVFTLLLLYGIFLDQVNRFLARFWKKRSGRIILVPAGLILAAAFSLAAVSYGCMLHAAGKKPQPNATVVILGCKVNGTVPSLTMRTRLDAAYKYLTDNPDSMCIVSGGMGNGEDITEAAAMYRWLCDHGIDPDRIAREERSTDTQENLTYSGDILRQHPEWPQHIAVATNEFHEYRALDIAKSLGFEASPVSAGTPWWLYPTYVVREMYGIMERWFLVR